MNPPITFSGHPFLTSVALRRARLETTALTADQSAQLDAILVSAPALAIAGKLLDDRATVVAAGMSGGAFLDDLKAFLQALFAAIVADLPEIIAAILALLAASKPTQGKFAAITIPPAVLSALWSALETLAEAELPTVETYIINWLASHGVVIPTPAPVTAESHCRGFKQRDDHEAYRRAKHEKHGNKFQAQLAKALPDFYLSPYLIKQQNQGDCGDCYCVSACVCGSMAAIAAGLAPNDGNLMLSADYLLWCHQIGGCGGGDATSIFDIMQQVGVPSVAQYGPYQDYDGGTCKPTTGMTMYKASASGYASGSSSGNSTLQEIATAINTYGAVVLTVDADALGDGTQIVTSAGYGVDHQIAGIAYYLSKNLVLAKNQWGNWGLSLNQALASVGLPTTTPLPPGVTGDDMGYVWIKADSSGNLAANASTEVVWVECGNGPLPPNPPAPAPTELTLWQKIEKLVDALLAKLF